MKRKRPQIETTLIERGLTAPQLRDEFERIFEEDADVDDEKLRKLFGPPPYFFLRNDQLGESGGYTARRIRTMPYILDSNSNVFISLVGEGGVDAALNAAITIKRHRPGREDDANHYYEDAWALLEPGGDRLLRATHRRDKTRAMEFAVAEIKRVGRRRATATATLANVRFLGDGEGALRPRENK